MRTDPTKKVYRDGVVVNPLRQSVAARLELERKKREITHKDLVEIIQKNVPGRMAYGTYAKTIRAENNITLKTLKIISDGLSISIADLLYGADTPPEWARRLDLIATQMLLARRLDSEREKRRMQRYEFAKFVGLGEITYAKLDRCRGNVSIDTIALIACSVCMQPLEFLFQESLATN